MIMFMNIKKIISVLAAAAVSTLVLAGCKGTPDSGSTAVTDGDGNVDASTVQWLPDVDIHNFNIDRKSVV